MWHNKTGLVQRSMGIGTGLADPAVAGLIICNKQEFSCSHHINFREREMNRHAYTVVN